MRVAILTNFIPPYRIPLFEALDTHTQALRIFLSTRMEPNRAWQPKWGKLDVALQKAWTFRSRWHHPSGFADTIYVHIPYDTIAQLRRYKPDIVITGELGLRTLLATHYCKFLAKIPVIFWVTVSEHTEQGRGQTRHWLRRWLFRQADAVLVNGKSGARYAQRFGIKKAQLFFAPYTPDITALARVPLERSEEQYHHLLYVGQLIDRKGLVPFLHTVCRWAEDHPDRTIDFWVAGDGPLAPTLETMPTPANLMIRLLGPVPFADLADLYAQVGFLAFPTLADEWGLVVNEAMVAGVPVLGSLYSQAVEELVTDAETGWTFHPDAADEMYHALDAALQTTPDRHSQMRLRARERARAITPETIAQTIMQTVHYVAA